MRPHPDDLAVPDLSPDECYAFAEEEEYAIQSNRPRATAIGFFARDHGAAFVEVSCRRRYLRLFTRRESYGGDEETVPENWTPGEADFVWAFCKRDTVGAIPCWELELKLPRDD